MSKETSASRGIRAGTSLWVPEHRYYPVIEHIPAIVYTAGLDPDRTTFYVSSQVESVLGIPPEEWIATPNLFVRHLHPEDRSRVLSELARCASSGNPLSLQYRMISRHGQTVWLLDEARVVRDAVGHLLCLQGIWIDMTDRRRIEEELDQWDKGIRSITENLPDSVARFDWQLRHLYLNRRIGTHCLLAPEIYLGKTNAEIGLPKALASRLDRTLRKVFEKRLSISVEFTLDNSEGTRYFESRIVPEFAQAGHVETVLALTRDVTELKQTEASLRDSKERYRAITENAYDLICEVNEAGQFVYVSPHFQDVIGYTPHELLGTSCFSLIYPEDLPGVMTEFMRGVKEAAGQIAHRVVMRSGESRWFESTGRAFRTATDDLRVVIVSRDSTERIKAEEQTQLALKQKDTLLKEIHHRVKNNLQIISSLLRLQAHSTQNPETRAVFDESLNRIHSMALIHKHLYESVDLSTVNLAEYLRALTTMLFRTYAVRQDSIMLRLNVTDVMLDIDKAVPCALIVNELVSNALKHAFPNGQRGQIEVLLDMTHEHCIIRVIDNGVGLPPDTHFETAESFGLQLVKLLTTQLGGTVEIHQDTGFAFTLYFPVSNELNEDAHEGVDTSSHC